MPELEKTCLRKARRCHWQFDHQFLSLLDGLGGKDTQTEWTLVYLEFVAEELPDLPELDGPVPVSFILSGGLLDPHELQDVLFRSRVGL